MLSIFNSGRPKSPPEWLSDYDSLTPHRRWGNLLEKIEKEFMELKVMYSTLLLKWDWERSKRLLGTDRETQCIALKWNVRLSTELPQLRAGHCHLQHQLLKISRKVAETLPWPHGGSSFLAILQPSDFCEQQRTEGESEVLSCFIRDSHCMYLLFTSGLLISQAVVWKFPIIISTLNEFTFPGRWFP